MYHAGKVDFAEKRHLWIF